MIVFHPWLIIIENRKLINIEFIKKQKVYNQRKG